MKKLYKRFSKLVFKFTSAVDTGDISKHPYHLNYESGVYREKELIRIIRDAMPNFALTPDEYSRLKADDDIGEMFRIGFSRISKAKKNKKGDYGELLLFLLLKTFYDAERLVTKVRLRSSVKDQVKGFDCAHFVVNENNEVQLWLGEVKFYKSFSDAVSDILSEISDHTKSEYLKDEFSILLPNIESNKGIEVPESIIEFLDGTITLDDVKIVIPALVTYESALIKKHQKVDDVFKDKIKKEFENKFKTINKHNVNLPENVEIFFILLPLEDVTSIKTELEKIEEAFR
ncbi:MAG: DUF1837 domain-containing protein [Colwellia sp.]|nr:DUF1837 domain-containing protein [Colwellia sp.]